MLYESNKFNYFTLKYIPLFFGLFISLNGLYLFLTSLKETDINAWSVLTSFLFLIVGTLGVLTYRELKDKWRIVAISKTKIIIDENKEEKEFNWQDVESISLNRFIGCYKLKIKNRDEIFFTPYGLINPFTGDQSDMGQIINKYKKYTNM